MAKLEQRNSEAHITAGQVSLGEQRLKGIRAVISQVRNSLSALEQQAEALGSKPTDPRVSLYRQGLEELKRDEAAIVANLQELRS
jgi:hypothetical protein